MNRFTKFQYCPACASAKIIFPSSNSMKCQNCGYVLYHNTAAACAVILKHQDKIVFIRRGHEPQKGKLDLPGGFIDYDESAEAGLLRELREETGFTIRNLQYFSSSPNIYEYKNVTYHTCDLCFSAEVDDISLFTPSDEVPELLTIAPSAINLADIAFVSLRSLVERYIKALDVCI